ncbi:MAG TPA: competence protein CoiA family protein, partial [Clostridia bacterium]|nr:competence protein CoiA family protein [Clostridia bacterium]
MFVALKAKNQTRVTSIASEWDNAEEELRAMAAAGELVCPGCKQSLWLRTGRRRRRHFAHRNLADCPLEHQSPEVLEVKAHLFRWLEKKYPGQVNLDITIGVPGCDRTLDLVVQSGTESKFAYCIFDRQQRERYDILRYQALDGVSLQFIHTASTLETAASNTILLSASQRDFITSSDFDTECSGHIHFIAEDSTVSLYRGLRCVHRPNVYHYAVRRKGLLET